jgi:signal transduction histidine kinase
MTKSGGKLRWRFDASTYRLLGRDLITDRITAIYELVKNCYDANAENVYLDFHEINTRTEKSQINIRDDGHGMSIDDIESKWLMVGTSNKRKITFSPKPYSRRYIGEKGVGRFATDKLGGYLRIRTKRKEDPYILQVFINWDDYDNANKTQQSLFTDIENEYSYIDDNLMFENGYGTELSISMLHQAWDDQTILRVKNQLSRILSPVYKPRPPFRIFINAPLASFYNEEVKNDPIESVATIGVIIPFDEVQNKQGKLVFNKENRSFDIKYEPAENFGLVRLEFYYFDEEAQQEFKRKYDKSKNYIEGVKIYRDGVICTPFAEFESSLHKRRDILGIDRSRQTDIFNKLSTREVIGVVDITKDRNPYIVDATNRQDFIDNEFYTRLKEFIIEQLGVLVEYKMAKREDKKNVVQNKLKRASADVKSLESNLVEIVKSRPDLKTLLTPAIEQAKQAQSIVKEGVKDQQETEKEFLRKENIYISLMSLQEFANDLAHGIRLAITPIKHAAEYFKENYPNPKFEKRFIDYSHSIYNGTEKVSHLVDFMLSYTEVDIEDVTFSVKSLLDDILVSVYGMVFEKEGIDIEINIKSDIELTGNRKFMEDVLANLISNSIKALKQVSKKKIVCESYADFDYLYILFSDNGHGVDEKIKDKMFEMFKTTTAEQGGAGLGLYIAKARMEALNGKIELIFSVFHPEGATFRLSLPLKPTK